MIEITFNNPEDYTATFTDADGRYICGRGKDIESALCLLFGSLLDFYPVGVIKQSLQKYLPIVPELEEN